MQIHVFFQLNRCILLHYNSLPCGTKCFLGRPQAPASIQGEPRREIPHDPPPFSLAAYVQTCFYCKEISYYFLWIYLSLDTETTSVSLFHILKWYAAQ